MSKYILSIDQGTTSSRSLLVDKNGNVVKVAQKEFEQIFPQSGWVEHDPNEILSSQLDTISEVLDEVSAEDIIAIGITNQRETTVVWDKNNGKPVYNAIVWQDRRTAQICEQMKNDGLASYIKENTGLVIDAYFSGTKLKWILDNVDGARDKAANGDLLFGTVDSWLIWNLTKGKSHKTDHTNASRTLLYNIKDLVWDNKMCSYFDIPLSMLPQVQDSSSDFGTAIINDVKIPIFGVAGDQQSALFGQACFSVGEAKNTYGTGCFMLMNTGDKMYVSNNGLLTTIAIGSNGKPVYALEGSVFIAGAAVQWLRDGIKIIADSAETEQMAFSVEDNDVVVVPAFAGLGAPYWDMYARGAIFGLTRDTSQNQIAKATLQSLAFQTKDVLDAMVKDANITLKTLKVDGGASKNNFLMQFQSDILDTTVERPTNVETTAMGAAYLAGMMAGIWTSETIENNRKVDRLFTSKFEEPKRTSLYANWQKAVKRSMGWLKE